MSQLVIIRHTAIMTLVLLLSCAQLALAQIQPGDAQRQAAVEVAESLRYGHYADAALDDAWSQLAFERYLDILDGQRAFLLERDIEEFRHLEERIDDMLFEGDLTSVYQLYQRYHDRAESRFEWLLSALDQGLNFTYETDMRLDLDRRDADWATSEAELDDLWRKRLKNAALTLDISGQDEEQVTNNLRQRYEGQLSRLRQTNGEDVFGLFMAAVTSSIDPHTEYLSPRQGESFDIQMRLSLEGIGAMLQSDGEYVKVTSLVPGGPADRAGVLEPADRIVGVGQEDEDEVVNVVGMRLDEVVDL
ncbi:MAG: PDZ domain-containing protein, partial [Halomonas sp.]|nr:PDZ domain-containing protein [Halomonas sp.]MDX5502607.1 PDZ domain-containing protein [Halomonas sp.]